MALQIAVLSTSRIVAEVMREIGNWPEVEVTAIVCRPQSAEKAHAWAAEYGVPAVYTDEATRVLSGEFDIEIVEKHHHNKLDAPSGTALMIADAINAEAGNSYEYVYDRSQVRQKRGAKELGISSVRGGGIVGEHDVLFCGPEEVLTLSHSAGSRGVFADGAVQAALYVAGREPGYYTMADLLRGKLPCV